MEMLQLRYFYESARTGSFAKTAKKYMVPSSSVSITVKHLESELGCQLFERHSNRIVLNDNGKKLQLTLEKVFSELDKVVAELSSSSEQTVKIKMLVLASRPSIINTIINYQKMYPNVLFDASFKDYEAEHDSFDVIVSRERLKIAGYESLTLYTRRLSMVVSQDSELCGKELTLRDLRDQPFVLPSQRGTTYNILMNACEGAGFVPKIAMVVNDDHYYNRCLRGGVGIGFTSMPRLSDTSVLRMLNVTDFNEEVTYYVTYKKQIPHIQTFVEYLSEQNFLK